MGTTILDWAVTLAGGVFMVQIIAMAYRYALSPAWVVTGRRKALLVWAIFLSVCLLLASAVFVWRGPIHLVPGFLSLLLGWCIVLPAAAVLVSWVRLALPFRQK